MASHEALSGSKRVNFRGEFQGYWQTIRDTGPVISSMILQSLFILIEMYFVAQLGSAALAAMGIGNYLFSLFIAPLVGLSVAAQAMAATGLKPALLPASRRLVAAAHRLAWLIGPIIAATAMLVAPALTQLFGGAISVAQSAAIYLVIRVLALPTLATNGVHRGYWNGIGSPGVYAGAMAVIVLINIALDYMLIFGKFGLPEFGLNGAALGYVIATGLGTGLFAYLARSNRAPVNRADYVAISRLSAPFGTQQLFAVLSFPVQLFIMGMVSNDALSAGSILINFYFMLIILAQAFGITAATRVCMALGVKSDRTIIRDTLKVSVTSSLLLFVISALLVFFPEAILGLFTSDVNVISISTYSMQIIGVVIPIDAVGIVLLQTMLTANLGRKLVLISIFLQWVVAMPLSYIVSVELGYGLTGFWSVQGLVRVVLSMILVLKWWKLPLPGPVPA